MSRIETLPKDMIEKITNELSPQDFVNFCSNNYSICNTNEVYFRRMQKDFPFLIPYYPDINKRAKNIYLEIFSAISQVAEQSVDLLLNYLGKLSQYLKASFREDFYSFFFNQIVEILKSSLLYYSSNKNINSRQLSSYYIYIYQQSFGNSLLKYFKLDRPTESVIFYITSNFIDGMFKQLLGTLPY